MIGAPGQGDYFINEGSAQHFRQHLASQTGKGRQAALRPGEFRLKLLEKVQGGVIGSPQMTPVHFPQHLTFRVHHHQIDAYRSDINAHIVYGLHNSIPRLQ